MVPRFSSLRHFIRCRQTWHQHQWMREGPEVNDLTSMYFWCRDNDYVSKYHDRVKP